MIKVYLIEDKKQVMLLRDLNSIKARCGSMACGYEMPQTTDEEQQAVNIVINYCKRNIALQLKNNKPFAKLSSNEDTEIVNAQKQSLLVKTTVGSCCVYDTDTEKVLAELKQLGLCKTVQEALKTGKHIFFMV